MKTSLFWVFWLPCWDQFYDYIPSASVSDSAGGGGAWITLLPTAGHRGDGWIMDLRPIKSDAHWKNNRLQKYVDGRIMIESTLT